MRLVADLIRGKDVNEALDILQFTNKKGRIFLKKAVLSGVASANEKYGVDKDGLKISHISVDGAPIYKKRNVCIKGSFKQNIKEKISY